MLNRPKNRAAVNWLAAIGRQGILALGLLLILAGCGGGGGGGGSAPAATNTNPVANAGTLAVTKNTAQSGTLSATDADGDALTYSIVTNGTKGVAAITNAATGAYTYTPNANATGSDSFTFKANDTKVDSNTATISVTITNTAVNNAPVANAETLAVVKDVAKNGTLSATDADGDALTYSIVTNGTKGVAAITNTATGAYTYTPNANTTGTDSFTFKANDTKVDSNTATISVTITAVNNAPVANAGTLAVVKDVAKNGTLSATDADGDALTYTIVTNGTKGVAAITNAATGAYTYTPNANTTGTDTFAFKANDTKVDSNTANITVTISNVVVANKVPDTGQTVSYTSTFGEDHDYTINPPSYTTPGNGTVTDNVTGLMWQQQDDSVPRTWANAITYCDNLSLGGYSDWRLPSKKELVSIVILASYNPAINTTAFPSTITSYYWSSTTYANDTDHAWIVYFGNGHVGNYDKPNTFYARCVRGGQ